MLKKIKKKFYLFLSFLVLASCNTSEKFQTHESGLKYKFIVHNKNGIKPEIGDILVLNMKYSTEDDSLLFNTREFTRKYHTQMKEPSHEGGSIEDAFAMMSVGDSARFLIDAQSFFQKTRKSDIPPYIKPGSKLIFDIKLVNIQSIEEFEEERRAIRHSNENEQEEMKILNAYLERANINVEPFNSGLYYIEEVKGTGKQAEFGKTLIVHYTGTFIDGKVFDSTLRHNEPLTFILGEKEKIQWEEGIAKMKEGGRSKLIIPSHLAYGGTQTGPIPPYSTLIFEVELLEVKN